MVVDLKLKQQLEKTDSKKLTKWQLKNTFLIKMLPKLISRKNKPLGVWVVVECLHLSKEKLSEAAVYLRF